VDATLLAGDEDTAWVRRIVAAVSLVDISAFDLATSKLDRRISTALPSFAHHMTSSNTPVCQKILG
jgi:hypothetical protein